MLRYRRLLLKFKRYKFRNYRGTDSAKGTDCRNKRVQIPQKGTDCGGYNLTLKY